MAINNVSVQYNGGFLPDMILLILLCYYRHRETRLYARKRFCLCSLLCCHIINVLALFSLVWGMLKRFGCVQIFFFKHRNFLIAHEVELRSDFSSNMFFRCHMASWHKEEEEASRRRATKRDSRDLEPPTHL